RAYELLVRDGPVQRSTQLVLPAEPAGGNHFGPLDRERVRTQCNQQAGGDLRDRLVRQPTDVPHRATANDRGECDTDVLMSRRGGAALARTGRSGYAGLARGLLRGRQ